MGVALFQLGRGGAHTGKYICTVVTSFHFEVRGVYTGALFPHFPRAKPKSEVEKQSRGKTTCLLAKVPVWLVARRDRSPSCYFQIPPPFLLRLSRQVDIWGIKSPGLAKGLLVDYYKAPNAEKAHVLGKIVITGLARAKPAGLVPFPYAIA